MTTVDFTEFIKDPANWKSTSKLDYSIWAKLAAPGIDIYNYMECATVTTTEDMNVVLSGLLGEQWVVKRERFIKSYVRPDGSDFVLSDFATAEHDGWIQARVRPIYVPMFAVEVPCTVLDFDVITAWGATLTANSSKDKIDIPDFIVVDANRDGTPKLDDPRVVDGRIFRATYDLTNFHTYIYHLDLPLPPSQFCTSDADVILTKVVTGA